MQLKDEIINITHTLGFADVGFASAEPFTTQAKILSERKEMYDWAEGKGIMLFDGTNPKDIMPGAKTIIVLIESYFQKSFPKSLEGNFGRCYLDDDRITKKGLSKRVKEFRHFLGDKGINSKSPPHLPHRLAAARAGLGTFGEKLLVLF